MTMRLPVAISLCAVALLAACQPAGTGEPAKQAGTGLGVQTAWMDTAARPGDDWYEYGNGGWLKVTEIPADRSDYGGFTIAADKTEAELGSLFEGIAQSSPKSGTSEARIKNFYSAYMDTAGIEQAGLAPIQPDLQRYAAIGDKAALSRVLGSQIRADVDPLNATDYWTENLFGVFVTQALQGGEVLPYILQGGLGISDRSYYLSDDPNMVKVREAYRKYIADVLTAAGLDHADARAQAIYDLELKIARAHVPIEQAQDFTHGPAIWTRAELEAKAPGLDWGQFLDAAQLGGQQKFEAYEPAAITGLSALVASQPLDVWKDWLAFHQISKNAEVLPKRFDALSFAFYDQTVRGTPQQRPRGKRAIAKLGDLIGDDVGRLYVAKYFPPENKAQIEAIVRNIKNAFAARVRSIDWLAPETKAEALKKVESIVVGVGYPDTWTDYASLKLDPDTAYADEQNAMKFNYQRALAKIGKPQDRGEWWMTPQTVNAVNLPVQNALNFPAAILQPPFFDPSADAAFNYGAIGSVIGHEISHSFDDNGAAFDASGALHNWWTKADHEKFDQAGAALAAQFDAYEVFPGLHVKGRQTLGENIADVAGLGAAYDAYRASLGGKEAPKIGGFTGDQRFFIAWDQYHARKWREARLRSIVATNEHAPDQYRALTVRNIDAWYDAFGVKPGDKLYLPPDQRDRVW